jgi:hypothetical protein
MSKHVYKHYENLGITVCQNCSQFQKDIEAIEHYIFESGYCDPNHCPRCKAEVCDPLPPVSIKPVRI